MSKPFEQIEVHNGGNKATGGEVGPFEGKRHSTASIEDKVKAIKKPLLVRKDEEKADQVTCCCFDVFKKRNSSKAAKQECEDRKRGFLYWFVTILAL